jgi:hypothetical protein
MFKPFRKERIQLAGIAGAVGVEPLLSDLQLGSAGIIEVDHSECAGFILVGGGEGGRESGNPSRQLLYSCSNQIQGGSPVYCVSVHVKIPETPARLETLSRFEVSTSLPRNRP